MSWPVRGDREVRSGLTLVELLVAITIIAILGALLLGVAATATGTAREAKTKSMVTRLHTLLMDRYDLYRTRRVELSPIAVTQLLVNMNPSDDYSDYAGIRLNTLNALQNKAAARVAALREMMLVEMPDRWSDIVGYELPTTTTFVTSRHITPSPASPPHHFLSESPTLWSAYSRAYNRIVTVPPTGVDPHINTISGVVNTRADVLANQGAECLYLVIMNATGDGEARSLFSESDVGDTDGDGALEFLDGWGNPISYLRWAPGFESDAQLSVAGLQQTFRRPPRGKDGVRPSGLVAVTNAVLEDRDPYDLFFLDKADLTGFTETNDVLGARGWRLVPLIASPGPDEELGMRMQDDFVAAADPYANVSGTNVIQRLGEAIDPDSPADNIHNHQLGTLVRTQ